MGDFGRSWASLGLLWVRLGPNFAAQGLVLSDFGRFRPIWGDFGPAGSRLGTSISLHRGRFWLILGDLGRVWASSGSAWALIPLHRGWFQAILGDFRRFGVISGPLGVDWGPRFRYTGASVGRFGVILASLGPTCASFSLQPASVWALLTDFCIFRDRACLPWTLISLQPASIWAILARNLTPNWLAGSRLGRSKGSLGADWGALRARWGSTGALWGLAGGRLWRSGSSLGAD